MDGEKTEGETQKQREPGLIPEQRQEDGARILKVFHKLFSWASVEHNIMIVLIYVMISRMVHVSHVPRAQKRTEYIM